MGEGKEGGRMKGDWTINFLWGERRKEGRQSGSMFHGPAKKTQRYLFPALKARFGK